MTAFAPYGGDYGSGHPWYYRLGGRILYPREIRDAIYATPVDDHHAEGFSHLDRKAEPERSHEIQAERAKICAGLRQDIKRYRQVVCEINHLRRFIGPATEPTFLESLNEPNQDASLKHNHICYGFAKLQALDALNVQQDLFAFL